ncbi:lipopolysaccharide heptosyltransferase II [Methylomonas methanica MC09]|uniref:lipopolysaccharide heptosyltransferase II n=2 Tax=Methylomonas methanica TaxID=421 RepID=F9ZXH1_METMM|nr:lipopolysaccharide heptosyltransferase II [Methylomonas methanica]AEG00959.1 lipopolysaccharide heptosyltransferase II [Methylomonas methanica MC09]
MVKPFNILVVGPSWVGDMVMAQSLFIVLKHQYPDCKIDVLAPTWSLKLLQRMPQVHSAIAMPLGHGQFDLLGRIRIGRGLRSHQYDQAFVLPNSWKSALIPFFAGIPKRTGYIGEMRWGLLNDARKLDKSRLTMTVQRFVALANQELARYPFPKLEISSEQQQAVTAQFAVNNDTKILALCPGAEYGPAKRWPIEHFAAVARHMHRQGWQVWLLGSDKDKPVAEQINVLSEQVCRNFAGSTNLAEAVDLMSLADVVVSNDSGLMHVAAALDKKLIALYGSSDPGFTPPLHKDAEIITLGLDCSPCFKRECPLGHTHCLTDIAPERVIAAIPR